MSTPKLGPALKQFQDGVTETLGWLSATEALWMMAPPTTQIRQKLKAPQLEALYESAFLRLFTSWEMFLEEATVRMLAGAASTTYSPRPAEGVALQKSVKDARVAVYGSKDYLLWHSPDRVANRVGQFLLQSPIETELRSGRPYLEHLANLRHRIAHSSTDAKRKFDVAAVALTGSRHAGKVGKLLRAFDTSDSLNPRRWIVVFERDLADIAMSICS